MATSPGSIEVIDIGQLRLTKLTTTLLVSLY